VRIEGAPDTTAAVADGLAFAVPTAPLAAPVCPDWAATVDWALWVGLEGSVCSDGAIVALPFGEPGLRFVVPDCDNDRFDAPEDCDDINPAVYPGAVETWYDGVDSDCSATSDFDQDGDHVDSSEYGGDDCNDLDARAFPGGREVCDGSDNDCDPTTVESGATLYQGGVPTDWPDAAAALAAAVDLDEIALCPGVHPGPLHIDVDVILRGVPGAPDQVVIDADGAGSAVIIDGAEPVLDVTLSDLTITGGVATVGGGIDARGADDLEVAGSVISGNVADLGGGIAIGDNLTLSYTVVADNRARRGGGLYGDRNVDVEITSSEITGNHADEDGGGLVFGEVTLSIDENSVVSDNDATGDGGGMAVTGDLDLDGGLFSANTAGGGGGGLWLEGGNNDDWEVDDATFDDNSASAGGGIGVDGGTVTVRDTVFTANDAVTGGGISLNRAVFATLRDLEISDCTASDGGAVWAQTSPLLARGGTWTTNSASNDGGGLWANVSTVTLGLPIEGIDVTANTAGNEGGGVWVHAGLLLHNTGTIDDNIAATGGGLRLDGGDGHVLTDSTVDGNIADEGGGFVISNTTVLALGTTSVSGNSPDGGQVGTGGTFTACASTSIGDPISNGLDDQDGSVSCFTVEDTAVSQTCTGC
jgi:hypothetical protein